MTQTPRTERRGRAAAQFSPGMAVRLKAAPDTTGTIIEPHEDGWWDTLLIPGVAKWDQLLVESPGDAPLRRWRLVADLEPVPAEPETAPKTPAKPVQKTPPAKKQVTPRATP